MGWVDQSENPSLVTTQDKQGVPSVNSMPAFTQHEDETRTMIPAWSNCADGVSVKAVVSVASAELGTAARSVWPSSFTSAGE